jgi:hypothetical protein
MTLITKMKKVVQRYILLAVLYITFFGIWLADKIWIYWKSMYDYTFTPSYSNLMQTC